MFSSVPPSYNHPSNTSTKNDYKDDPIFQTYNNDLFLVHIGHLLICVNSSYNKDLLKRYFSPKVLYITSDARVSLLKIIDVQIGLSFFEREYNYKSSF